jgi:hypothetical protein
VSRDNREAALKVNQADPDLSTGARYLLLFTGDLVGDGRKLEAGCDWLAVKLGASDSAVRRWREELVEAGYLVPDRLVRGGQRANTYHLNLTPRQPTNPPDMEGTTLYQRRVTASTTLQQPSANPPDTDPVTLREPSKYGGEPEPKETGTPTGPQLALAKAEADKANGVLIDGEPIRYPKALGMKRYREEPGYWDDQALKARKALTEDEARAQLERMAPGLVDELSMPGEGE